MENYTENGSPDYIYDGLVNLLNINEWDSYIMSSDSGIETLMDRLSVSSHFKMMVGLSFLKNNKLIDIVNYEDSRVENWVIHIIK